MQTNFYVLASCGKIAIFPFSEDMQVSFFPIDQLIDEDYCIFQTRYSLKLRVRIEGILLGDTYVCTLAEWLS